MKALLCVMSGQGVIQPVQHALERHRTETRLDWDRCDPKPDAAVDRARSAVASEFLAMDRDVLVMLDYDVEVPRPADFDYLAAACATTRGIVGAVVSKKNFGEGFGGRFADGAAHELYSDELVELGEDQYVGGAFTAYHREVFEAMIAFGMPHCPAQGFWPFFQPALKYNNDLRAHEYLSEDWAICHYARELAHKPVHVAMQSLTIHHGRCGFSALDGNMAR